MRKHIANINKNNLEIEFAYNDIKKFHAKQVFEWIHKKHILDLDKMSNLSKDLKKYIVDNYDIDKPVIVECFDSKIDETKKFLIKLKDNNMIESVLMTYSFGKTLCVSTQVGCAMGCKFCASTIDGLIRNLECYEILFQVYLVEEYLDCKISNVVVMGIGEPLNNLDNLLSFINILNDEDGDNISKRNITVSTCGIVPNIVKIANENSKFSLALSLHAPNDEIRKKIMPIASRYDMSETLDAMALFYKNTKRRITIEYALIDKINSDNKCATELYDILYKKFIKNHIDFNVNLIPVNEVKERCLKRPNIEIVNNFKNILEKNNINVTVRRELGKDISGSCGQLRRGYS